MKRVLVLVSMMLPLVINAQTKLKKRKYWLTYQQEQIAQDYFLDGVKFLMLEDNDRALKMFKKSLQIDYNKAATHHQIALIEEKEKNYDLALPHAKFAYDNDRENEYHYLSLATIYLGLNKQKEGIKIYEKLVRKFRSETYIFQLADIYYRSKEFDKCLALLTDYTLEYGVLPEVIGYKQNIYRMLKKVDRAIEEGQDLIDSEPDNPRYTTLQMELLLSENRIEEAKTLGESFLKTNGDNANILLLISEIQRKTGMEDDADKNYFAAFESPDMDFDKKIDLIALQTRKIYFSKINRVEDAKTLELTKKMCNSIVVQYPEESRAHSICGDFFGMTGEKEKARNHYLRSLQLDDTHFSVWEQVVLIDAELEQYDSLITHSEKALEIFPNKGVIWYFNGSAYLVKRDYKKSIQGFEQAKKLSHSDPKLVADINAQLGDAYNGDKQYEKSDLAYDDVLKVNPENEHVLNNYSYFLSLRNEELDKAYKMSKKILDKRPDNATYVDTHAWVLYKMKRYQEARELLEKIQNEAKGGEVAEHYGDVLFQLGEKEQALNQWKKAKTLGGGSDLLDNKIENGQLYE